jgi:hypothetical protein
MTTTKATTSKSSASNWSARLNGAFWLALILFALGRPAGGGQAAAMDRRPGRRRGASSWARCCSCCAGWPSGATRPTRLGGPSAPSRSVVRWAWSGSPRCRCITWPSGSRAGRPRCPLATLSNGQKTVVFQGMQHIGSEGVLQVGRVRPRAGARGRLHAVL